MSARKPVEPVWIGALSRVYAASLWLYPRSHRERWGAEMRLAFRDRCREAARNGHGPLRVLFAELLPDLANTVGLEHVDSIYLETNPMKRLLIVLVFTFVAVVMLRPDVSPALDAVHDWNQHRQEMAYDRAYSVHLDALAQATEQHRRDSHDDVTAAMLYRAAAQGDWSASMIDAIGSTAADALQDRADAAFSRALHTNDRWALWLAARACPARATICQPDRSLVRLEQLDPDNGAVWALDLAVALHSGDTTRARAALARMAHADRFDTQSAQTAQAALAAFDRLPVPASLPQHADADSAAELAQSLVERYSGGYLFNEYLELKPFSDYCRSSDPQVHAERRGDCRATGKLMVEHGNLYFGYFAWMRNADPGELGAAREAFRVRSWQSWGFRQYLNPRSYVEFTPAMWRAVWAASDHRRAVAMHVPMKPPADFQLTAQQDDPWY